MEYIKNNKFTLNEIYRLIMNFIEIVTKIQSLELKGCYTN